MVEEQIAVEVLVADLQPDLPADVGEALAQLEQEAGDVVEQGLLEVSFMAEVGVADEVEQVRVPGGLLGQVGVCGWDRGGKVRDRLP